MLQLRNEILRTGNNARFLHANAGPIVQENARIMIRYCERSSQWKENSNLPPGDLGSLAGAMSL
jgi:hypothetical protein